MDYRLGARPHRATLISFDGNSAGAMLDLCDATVPTAMHPAVVEWLDRGAADPPRNAGPTEASSLLQQHHGTTAPGGGGGLNKHRVGGERCRCCTGPTHLSHMIPFCRRMKTSPYRFPRWTQTRLSFNQRRNCPYGPWRGMQAITQSVR